MKKKPLPPDTGGAPKPARTRAITGETPVRQHVEKIESKEVPSSTPPYTHLFVKWFRLLTRDLKSDFIPS